MQKSEKWILAVRCILLSAALMLLAFGIMGGQPEMILQKAIHICLECIGIG